MPVRVMPPNVAAGYYDNGSCLPYISSVSHCQSGVPVVPLTPANYNPVNCISTPIQNPVAGLPLARCDPPPALLAEAMNSDARQRLFQQQFVVYPVAMVGNDMWHPFAVAPMPLLAPGCIPASGIHPGPMVRPVLQPSLVPTQLNNDHVQSQGQVMVKHNVLGPQHTVSNARMDWTNSKPFQADLMARSLGNVCAQSSSARAIHCNRWLCNPVNLEEIWTEPGGVKNTWNSALVDLRNSRWSHISNGEQNHSLKPAAVGGFGHDLWSAPITSALDLCRGAENRSSMVTDHCEASRPDTGLSTRHDIWPIAFGPFTGPPQSSHDSVSRLPPGLETEVMARIGVIGQRGPAMQENASVQGCDSDVDSVSCNSQGQVSNRNSGKLPLASTASETDVSNPSSFGSVFCEAVEPSSVVSLPKLSNADRSKFTNSSSSSLLDNITSVITETEAHQKNVSLDPRQHSHSYLSTNASEDTSAEPPLSSHLDADRPVEQISTSSLPSSTAVDRALSTDNTALLRDIIAQLLDMLCKPEELRFADICSALYDKLAASSSSKCLPRDSATTTARTAATVGAAVSCSTNPCTCVSEESLFCDTSAAGGQDEDSSVSGFGMPASGTRTQDPSCVSAPSSANSDSPTNQQTPVNYGASVVCDNESAVDGSSERSSTDNKSTVGSPLTRTDVSSVNRERCRPEAADAGILSVADEPSLRLRDTAALQQMLSKIALQSFQNDSEKLAEHASSGSSLDDLLALLQRLK